MENTVRLKEGVRRGNTYCAESRNKKGAAYVSTEKNAWQGYVNIRINEEMENEYLNDGVEAYKEKREARMKAVRRGNAYYAESRKRKEAAYVSTEKNVWHRHGNMGMIEEMENEQVVVMKTTVGDIKLELWAKETAKACFIEIAYNDTIFHRIIKGFITQGGDPTGTGEGGKIYGEPFKDEFHTRLRFCQRDLIAVANAGKMTVVPNFSVLLVLHQNSRINIQSLNDRPLYPPGLFKSIILNNPFFGIIPRIIVRESERVKYNSKTKTASVKDINLLSFRAEAKEDEEESVILNKKFTGKGKSTHDHLTDPKLSSQQAVEPRGLVNKKRKGGRSSSDWENDDEVKTQEELEVSNEEKDIKCIERYKKGTKKVQNYKIDDVEDDKDIKENE
ncbi:Peptidyl-prolyl cis-trans isomerase CWC27 like protein [Eufriesea mexicana]|uniref:Spliceosome-associated protein CWC27 homolog n=1 Tax=Eufriesea mexicana TaxID=516756 RepID=A0A310S736_9HYME|nr:Peptidyl-prolyl cis-trans isomerase CWC27 like protein [Eufriesea mexicana]